jgi:hypothetical protein
MKFPLARTIFLSVSAVGLAYLPGWAQSHDLPPPPPQTAPATGQKPQGKVIFSRSIDEDGQTTTQAPEGAPKLAAVPIATDAERQAVTFVAFDMDVHLRAAEKQIAVRALLTVRNDGQSPLTRIPLQISSSLNWERIRVLGRYVTFPVATLNSDADHTGQLHEAAVPLANSAGSRAEHSA